MTVFTILLSDRDTVQLEGKFKAFVLIVPPNNLLCQNYY